MRTARELALREDVWTIAPVALVPLVLVIAVVFVVWRYGPLVGAGVLLGIGLGGFVDGIVFHQILQWHNMLSAVVPPDDLVSMKRNMIWDGAFHALTWTVTLAGVVMLFRAGHRRRDLAWTGATLGGAMLAGWGLFNLVEGLIDHQLLAIHHVHPGAHQLAWDLGFIASGVAFIAAGAAIARPRTPHGGAASARR